MRKIILMVLVATLAVAMLGTMGCSCDGTSDPSVALEGKTWVLESYGDPAKPAAALGTTEVTAIFTRESQGKINGSAGCNNYFGSYETDGYKITIGGLGSTQMFCEGVMDQEQQYLAALTDADTYAVDGNSLKISCADGKTVLNYTAK